MLSFKDNELKVPQQIKRSLSHMSLLAQELSLHPLDLEELPPRLHLRGEERKVGFSSHIYIITAEPHN